MAKALQVSSQRPLALERGRASPICTSEQHDTADHRSAAIAKFRVRVRGCVSKFPGGNFCISSFKTSDTTTAMRNPQNHAAAKVENSRALESNTEPNFREMRVVRDGLDFSGWLGRRL